MFYSTLKEGMFSKILVAEWLYLKLSWFLTVSEEDNVHVCIFVSIFAIQSLLYFITRETIIPTS